MNMKRLIKASMLLMIAALFVACANEDIAQDKKKENETEAPKGGVIFAANGPKTSAKRLSIDGEDEFAGAKTRTNIKHTAGQGADAYWTSDDFIYVKDKNGNFQWSTHTELHDGGASAEFTLPGSMADYIDGCEVRYTGTGAYNFALPPEDKSVGLASNYHIATANNFNDAGGNGDCGSGKAYATGNPAKFNFRLSHKATYLCFLPRCENATLAPNIRLTQIKLTATKCYSDPSTPLTDYFDFDGETIGPGGQRLYSSNSIYMNDFSFPLFTTANQEANAVYCVIRPDTYDFKIEYTIKDPTTNVEAVVTQTLTNKTFDKGLIYDITADLAPGPKYYQWDAKYDLWYNHLKADGTPDGILPQDNTDPRWYHEGVSPLAASESCKNAPNINELSWYVTKGDPHWDTQSRVMVQNGHLQNVNIDGIWLKTKAAIIRDNSDITATRFSNAYPGNDGVDHDWRYTDVTTPYPYPGVSGGNLSHGTPANTADYFFLPALGFYEEGKTTSTFYGTAGYYWTSSATVWAGNPYYAFAFSFIKTLGLSIFNPGRTNGYSAVPFE